MRFLLTTLSVLLGLHVALAQNSLLYEISGNGLVKKSYLFGTIHLRDQRVFYFNDSLLHKINACDQFALEIDLSEDALVEMQHAMFLPEGKTLDQQLNKKTYKKLVKVVNENTGLPEEMIKRLRLFSAISLAVQSQTINDREKSVDEYLYAYATSIGRKTVGLEEIDDQLTLMDSLTDADVLAMLDDTEDLSEALEEGVQFYRNSDLTGLYNYFMQDAYSEAYNELFLYRRNKVMANAMIDHFDNGSLFAAVGAAHLAGPSGIIALLKANGYSVSPVLAAKSEVRKLEAEMDFLSWGNYMDDEGRCQLRFPSEPHSQDQVLPFNKTEKIFTSSLLASPANNPNVMYGMTYTIYPKSLWKEGDGDYYLKQAVENYLNIMKGQVLSNKEITYEHVQGQELVLTLSENNYQAHLRIFFNNGILYLMQVLSDPNSNNELERAYFFNSLRFY